VREDLQAFEVLAQALEKPALFSVYTAEQLWNDPHTSQEMLKLHLDEGIDVSSRRAGFIDQSTAWLVQTFELGPGKRVIDFGCGPGLYTSRLARCGADVTGVDFSANSIAYAKAEAERAGQRIAYVQGDYLEYEPAGPFDLITMIMCDFCALSPAQRSVMLRKFAAGLAGDGRLVFDVYSLAAFDRALETVALEENLLNGFWSPSRYFGILASFKYETEAVCLDKYTLIEKDRQWTVFNWLQHFSPQSLERELNESGLVVEAVLGDVAGNGFDAASTEFAVVVRRA
jgi:SAM-dependent methyltransferase